MLPLEARKCPGLLPAILVSAGVMTAIVIVHSINVHRWRNSISPIACLPALLPGAPHPSGGAATPSRVPT